MPNIREIYDYREMLFSMVKRDLRTRYKGSFLGFLWTFINPLLQLFVYYVLFSTIMRINVDNYAMFLFVTLLPWIYFSTTILQSTNVIISNSNLIKKIYFPRAILPLSVAIAGLVNMLFGFVVVFLALIIFKIQVGISIIILPLIILNEFVFVLGLSFLFSALNVYFRDLEHILGIVTMAWFYLTPIIYPVNMVPEKYTKLFFINPMTSIILPFRDVLFYGLWPNVKIILLSLLSSIFILIFAFAVFDKLQRGFAEEI